MAIAEQKHLWDVRAKDLRAMSLLNIRMQSRSITVNLQSIRWPTTHEWNLAAFTDASILKKRKSSTIDFLLVLRLVNYINNSKQHHQQKKISWSSFFVSSVPNLSWRSARQVVILSFLFSFLPFTAFLQFCSCQSLAAWQFYCTPLLCITRRWNHCLKVGSQWDVACMLMTAQGGSIHRQSWCQASMPVWVTEAAVCWEQQEVSM